MCVGVVVGLRALGEGAEVVAHEGMQLEQLRERLELLGLGMPDVEPEVLAAVEARLHGCEVDLSPRVPSACTSVHDTRACSRAAWTTSRSSAHAADRERPRPTGRAPVAAQYECAVQLAPASTRTETRELAVGVRARRGQHDRPVARALHEQAQAHAREAVAAGRALGQPALEVGNALLEQHERRRGGVVGATCRVPDTRRSPPAGRAR